MNYDLFPPDESDVAQIAKQRLPRVRKPATKCAADLDNDGQRAEFQKALQRRSEAQMRKDRILAARAQVEAATPRKARKKKGAA